MQVMINGNPVTVEPGSTVLEAVSGDKYARTQFDIQVLSLQYLKDVQEKDDSGLCIVEIPGMGIVNAAETVVAQDMEIWTNTSAVVEKQQEALKGILAHHDRLCNACSRTGNCELQDAQYKLRCTKNPKEEKFGSVPIRTDSIIVRDDNKCIRCGRCVAACENVQGIGAIRMEGEGWDAKVVPAKGNLIDSGCVGCGQCITACPVGALSERDDVAAVKEALADPDKYVVIQAAPSVRVGLGEAFDYPVGSATKGKLAAVLRALGFDRVFDTVLSADLTIVEEATELISRIKNGGKLPMFTSCCPGWINYAENNCADLLDNISTCKSPHQMFGAMVKTYLSEKEGIPAEKIVVVSAMPCTAKKREIVRDHENAAGVPDVDYSLTTRELARMIKESGISFLGLPDEEFDPPLGIGTGAGTIFGATGGVMEAALRTANDWLGGSEQGRIDFTEVRGVSGIKEAVYKVGSLDLRVAVASGLKNAEKLIDRVRSGEAQYDFVEIMACPGGCVNGGGQPQQKASVWMTDDVRAERALNLYRLDKRDELRKSHENPAVQELYATYLGDFGGEKAKKYLHTQYRAKGM
ncbi:4Fe-4S dicluster domain-containing protein [Olsenella sp. AM30-3LB]|uniref:[FeFe] hydrogenase, group A n=1 Tax=Olsenella sp. AM30-3LB TaxID=2292359 RepID=UPI000E4F6670|nr:[FeFe] hydrogenase, group A [Olsenella sp. AM30-3LB]RHD73338.1 4Fe-4S dicluster domain-containing protein [Olsenella sp. AM30-3LB]